MKKLPATNKNALPKNAPTAKRSKVVKSRAKSNPFEKKEQK